ncbi:SipW-dependent-type signal peptide-containing protein [Haloplanus aerogenes]|uniref:Putative ribosomally synthesized peptide with SipW-like signal peptide n=1 Tax=Haloplanus aerogenes TaxID=660522 RepID=A0A3M0DVS1_9EURY|nr:SipW-dependent-type signal peptide-containing protein [Haloplanus aerogenes]AZH24694.1 hypothetical protein DU502_04525 [Haloplanus aerogenes]RMB23646.1 putative ribosomally synthesized peptide with SipW-like signal peptide [Haloplanus aerogenes]
MPDELELSRRKILAAVGSIGAASAGAGLGTSAFFSDQETFENNRLVAGELDLRVGYETHYSDWSADENDGLAGDVSMDGLDGGTLNDAAVGLPTQESVEGSPLIAVADGADADQFLDNTRTESFPTGFESIDTGTEIACDDDGDGLLAASGDRPVIQLSDVKPGDFGEVTITFAPCDNPGFVWANGRLVDAEENGLTEPEADDPDEGAGVELLDAVRAALWVDDGDNWQDADGAATERIVLSGTLREVLDVLTPAAEFGNVEAAQDGLLLPGDIPAEEGGGQGGNCFSAATAHNVVFAWWLPVDHANEIQTDAVTFDLGLYTEQCRHNRALPARRAFEIGEGVDTESGERFGLLDEVGFPELMVTEVDVSADPIEFTLDVPQSLDKDAGDRWELRFDADDDGTVDFRVVFDDFYYQEWDDEAGQWGPQQPVPADIETGVVDGIFVVRVPRDRLSDPFSFAGRVCYGEASPAGGDLCVAFTPEFDPTDGDGGTADDFQSIALGPAKVEGACCLSGDNVSAFRRYTCRIVEGTDQNGNKGDARSEAIAKCKQICAGIDGAGEGDCEFHEDQPCHPGGTAPSVENFDPSEVGDCTDCCATVDFDVDSPVPIYQVAIEARPCGGLGRDIASYDATGADDQTDFSLSDITEQGDPCVEKCQDIRIKLVPQDQSADEPRGAGCPNPSSVIVTKSFFPDDCGACCLAIKQNGVTPDCVLTVSKDCCERFGEPNNVNAVWTSSGTDCSDSNNNGIPDACEKQDDEGEAK